MPDATGDARHLSYANLEALWAAGNPQVLPVKGAPWCEIRLDPPVGVVLLRTEYQLPEPDLANLKNVTFEAVASGSGDVAEIAVRVGGNLPTAYGLLAAIADGLQAEQRPLAAAVSVGVARQRDILATRVGLSERDEIGLFGELTFLEFLMDVVGAGPAVAAWQGPRSEEHDFTLEAIHIEVKTTATERREHMIGGLAQLVPVPDVPLSLLSIQITRDDSGSTLPELVGRVRHAAGGHVPRVDALLTLHHWDPDDADLYPTSWTLRSKPRAYDVDEHFPAMTRKRIAPVVPRFALISRVAYAVDVTDLEHQALPEPYATFVEAAEE
jgi:hypothetical protein